MLGPVGNLIVFVTDMERAKRLPCRCRIGEMLGVRERRLVVG